MSNRPNTSNEPLSLSELTTLLSSAQEQAQTENKQLTVVIEGEKTRPYGEVIALMSSLQDVGLTQVGLLTTESEK